MQLKKLFGMQKELDKHINEEHNLQGENLIPKKILAFIVEISELANEIRFFKFWSSKPASHPNIVLEEYVDGLHFLLSIGNELEADKEIEEDFKVDYITKGSTTEEFIYIIQLTVNFSNHKICSNYYSLLNRYLALSYTLGFKEEKILRAYSSKNKINHLRQDQGY